MADEAPPLRLSVEAPRPEDLFEEGAFPFRGPILKESVRDHLLTRVRIARTVPDVELDFRFDRELPEKQKAQFERDLRAYYEVAIEEAHSELQVNHVEARRAFILGLIGSVIALAVAIPLRLYFGFDFYIVEFLCIVVVWILMWDSIEMLLWDAMLLRMRYTAARKLRDATIRYTPTARAGEGAPSP
jgi:hypothetical protein